jgi:hypothetical protein
VINLIFQVYETILKPKREEARMKKVYLGIGILAFIAFSCSEKKVEKTKIYKKDNSAVLQKANENFKELEIEAEKKPEELTLPDYSTQKKTKTAVNKKEYKPPKEKKLNLKTKYPLKNGYPVWVYNPNYGGYLGAVGIAKKSVKGGYPEQKRIAIMIAQANLAKQIRLVLNSKVYTEKMRISKKEFEEYKSKLYSLSKQSANEFLKHTVVKDEWIDEKTGDLYVWVVLEK